MNNISYIATEKLLPNPNQPRHQFQSEEMLALANSIKENGILQPLLIRRMNNSDYCEIIAGERRLRAAILAGIDTVPCIEMDIDREQSAVYSILENVQREDLSFFEEAVAIGQLMTVFGMTQQDISKALGKSQSALSNKVRLLKLPVDVRYFIEKSTSPSDTQGHSLPLRTKRHLDCAQCNQGQTFECCPNGKLYCNILCKAEA